MRTACLLVLLVVHATNTICLAQESATLPMADVFSSDSLRSACDAIAKDNYLKLPTLVEAGLDLNQPGQHGCTLLLWSWCHGYDNAFETLLELGADPHATLEADLIVDITGNELTLPVGSSVAAIVIRYSMLQPQFVEPVVRYLRDANQRDALGKTLFHNFLLATADKPIVRELRHAERFSVETLRGLQEHPLTYDAVKLVQSSPFALLSQAGVPAAAVDDAGLTALQQYLSWIESAKTDVSKIELATVRAIGFFGRTDYFDDASRRDGFIVDLERLITDPKAMLMASSTLKAYQTAGQEYYDQQRANGRVWFGDYGHFLFVEMYADILDEEVSMAVQGIPYFRHMKRVRPLQTLLDLEVDINVRGQAGLTHLFSAYTARDATQMESLLQLGADVDAQLDSDLWSYVSDSTAIMSSVVFCPEHSESILLSAALNPDREPYLRLALPWTKNADIRDDLNRNMLHRIMYHRLPATQLPLLAELVAAGVNLNAQSISGATPCHEAVFRNALIIPELVALGADPTLRDMQGRTVSDVLRQSIDQQWTFSQESAQALIQLQKLSPQP